MSVTQEIKSRLDIVDIVSNYVSLRKSGRSYAGFCPFHHNTKTPAFYVFPETQTWHCFGACAEGGDLFSFLMKKEGWDFKEALEKMADRAGIKLEQLRPVDKTRQALENKLVDLLTSAADYFHQLLQYAPQADFVRQYVSDRKLTEETQEAYCLGYSLDSWDACRTHFNSQGYSDEDLLKAGLLTENPEKGTRYDRFRNRLMIPIRNMDGQVVGFGARALDIDSLPKYLNSPQTELFNKSQLLYGLDMAKPYIREARYVVIVEGYMDVMQAWQAGYRNVVAQMGTALTESQLRLLKRFSKRFILALDADAAGFKATMRGLQVARETLDRDLEVRFDARGLVRHEGRLQADIRIVTIPEGNDPDKIISTNPEQWPKLITQAKPIVAYVIDMLTSDLDMNDAKKKTAVAQQVIPLIRDIPDPIERDHYWQHLARSLGVDERALRQIPVPEEKQYQANKPLPSGPEGSEIPPFFVDEGSPPKVNPLRKMSTTEFRQANYLQQCLHYPKVMLQVNQKLAQNEQALVTEADFLAAEDKALFVQMYHRINSSTIVTLEELCDSLDDLLLSRVESLSSLPLTPESELDRLADTLVLSVLDWRLEIIKQLLSKVKYLLHEAQNSNDVNSLMMYRQKLRELPLAVLRINKARDAMSSGSRRRAEDTALGRH